MSYCFSGLGSNTHTFVVNLANVHAAERKRQREEEERAAAEINVMVRPKGEAGSTTKGFNLQEAMGLSDKGSLYNEILVRMSQLTGKFDG